MNLTEEQRDTVRPYHQASSGSLRKIVGSAGKRQGNFFLVLGDTTAGLVITLSHKDPSAQQVKSKGKKLRTFFRKHEVVKFAQGVVLIDDEKRLVFSMLAGNARLTLIKQSFKDARLWRSLGFDKPDLLKRARLEMHTEDAEGRAVDEVAPADDDEVALSDDEIRAEAAFRFGDLPDLRTLLMSARDIAEANEAVLAALSELDGESEEDSNYDEIELALLEGGVTTDNLVEQLAQQYPHARFEDAQLERLATSAAAACQDYDEEDDLTALTHWLTEYQAATDELEVLLEFKEKLKARTEKLHSRGHPYQEEVDSSAITLLLHAHFEQRRRSRAVHEGLALFEKMDRSIYDRLLSAGSFGQSGADWRKELMDADAELFESDSDRLWGPREIAAAEQELLAFPREAPLTVDDWQPPTEDQARTRCPFLNLSANHGWIPRSGWVSYSQLRRALVERGALTATVADLLATTVFKRCGVTGPDGTEMLNLADLRHAGIFHPGGLAHEDDRVGADEDIVEMFAEISEDGRLLTEEDVRVAMKARHEESGAVGLEHLPFAFGEAFFIFNLLAKERPGHSEPTISVDDLRAFLADNRYPDSLRPKAPDDRGGLLDAVVGVADIGVDAYLPLASRSVNERVKKVLAERTLRAAIREQPEGMSLDEIRTLLADTEYIQDLDRDERAAGLMALIEHLEVVGVLALDDDDDLHWLPGEKLRPPEEPAGDARDREMVAIEQAFSSGLDALTEEADGADWIRRARGMQAMLGRWLALNAQLPDGGQQAREAALQPYLLLLELDDIWPADDGLAASVALSALSGMAEDFSPRLDALEAEPEYEVIVELFEEIDAIDARVAARQVRLDHRRPPQPIFAGLRRSIDRIRDRLAVLLDRAETLASALD